MNLQLLMHAVLFCEHRCASLSIGEVCGGGVGGAALAPQTFDQG